MDISDSLNNINNIGNIQDDNNFDIVTSYAMNSMYNLSMSVEMNNTLTATGSNMN
jgi:hypothetical protein